MFPPQDHMETERLLHRDNIDNEALRSYAREAADFGTNYQLPSLDYAVNSYDQPDVTMFDFTSMYASENAALLREKHGRQVLVALVGDSLLEVPYVCRVTFDVKVIRPALRLFNIREYVSV